MENETKTETVSTPAPIVKDETNLVIVNIDKEMTNGGIRINEVLYLGNCKVTKDVAKELLRIQDEFFETKKKLMQPEIQVRMKNDFQKETLFLADPKQNSRNPNFTRDYGLLGQVEWNYCSEPFKKKLLALRKSFYGY